jgi:hypothetical protein
LTAAPVMAAVALAEAPDFPAKSGEAVLVIVPIDPSGRSPGGIVDADDGAELVED